MATIKSAVLFILAFAAVAYADETREKKHVQTPYAGLNDLGTLGYTGQGYGYQPYRGSGLGYVNQGYGAGWSSPGYGSWAPQTYGGYGYGSGYGSGYGYGGGYGGVRGYGGYPGGYDHHHHHHSGYLG